MVYRSCVSAPATVSWPMRNVVVSRVGACLLPRRVSRPRIEKRDSRTFPGRVCAITRCVSRLETSILVNRSVVSDLAVGLLSTAWRILL